MNHREVDYTHDLPAVLAQLQGDGLLLTTVDADGRPNTMTIGWATIGVMWGLPMFVSMVRHSRFTFGNIEATGEFVVSVPPPELVRECAVCGSASGRDTDKFAECGFTTSPAETVAPPLIDQCVMHYECRVVNWDDVAEARLDAAITASCYPGKNFHRDYCGQILRTVVREP